VPFPAAASEGRGRVLSLPPRMSDVAPKSLRTSLLVGTLRVSLEVEGDLASEGLASRLVERGLGAARREIEHTLAAARALPEPPRPHPTIIGQSAPMLALFKMLERVQRSDATVLVLGENGTGKELVARGIHAASRRASKQFVATNCSAFNDNLLESEMFGHRRGAFTGAVADKPGLFETADGGTFFMDEVGDMSPALQVKLLRVLQEGTFMPVGGTESRKVDVRIVAATNRDLTAMVKAGTFREDLFYRLHVVSLRVPPLRERRDDIPVLVQHFLAKLEKREKRAKVLTPRTLERLVAHAWPGNVRELENEMERLWVLSGEDGIIDEDQLSPAIARGRIAAAPPPAAAPPASPPAPPPAPPAGPSAFVPLGSMPEAVEALERRMIGDELRKAKGNKTKAADALGISRRNLIRKVQAYRLEDGERTEADDDALGEAAEG
jgi:two-component system response regulator HupR/HoxA